MTREPDRYEAKAAEVGRQIDGSPWPDIVAIIAAALRQAADEALEKAAVAFAEAPTTQHSGAAVASVLRYLARDSAPQPVAAPAHEPERFFPGAAEAMGEPAAAPAAETPQKWGGPYLWPESAPPAEPVAPANLDTRARCEVCGAPLGTAVETMYADGFCWIQWRGGSHAPAPYTAPATSREPESSLLPRVLAVLDDHGDSYGGYYRALAAELRRYIATDPRDKRIAELEAALSDWQAVEAECGAVDCHCGCHVHATDLADGGEGK